MKIYEFLKQKKQILSTPRIQRITDLMEKYKELGETYESPTGKILLKIYNKNKKTALQNQKAMNTKLHQILSKPETFLLAYRSITRNQSA
jgi:hypothetical protein